MYAINKILTEMGLSALSFLENLGNEQGIDLIKMKQSNPQHAYYMTLLFYPKSILYKKDIEYVENIFSLCGQKVLESYINLIKYYSGALKTSSGVVFQYNIGIALDLFSNTQDITTYVTAEENTTLKLRTIKFPISALGDTTILKYAIAPETLLDDVLTKSEIKIILDKNYRKNTPNVERQYTMNIIDCDDINEYFLYIKGFVIGSSFVGEDIVCFQIMDNIHIMYVKDNTLYSFRTKLENICDLYVTDIDALYILYKSLISDNSTYSLTEFLDSLRGYVKMFIDQDIYTNVRYVFESNIKNKIFEERISEKPGLISQEKLYDYVDRMLRYN